MAMHTMMVMHTMKPHPTGDLQNSFYMRKPQIQAPIMMQTIMMEKSCMKRSKRDSGHSEPSRMSTMDLKDPELWIRSRVCFENLEQWMIEKKRNPHSIQRIKDSQILITLNTKVYKKGINMAVSPDPEHLLSLHSLLLKLLLLLARYKSFVQSRPPSLVFPPFLSIYLYFICPAL